MIIGMPREIENNESRVGMTPSGVAELMKCGHTVHIQHTVGGNNGLPDEAYIAAGAQILPTIEETYAAAQMIVKMKEPIALEYKLIRRGQLLFTYFHLASSKKLTPAMIGNGLVYLAHETVEKADHSLPLLTPMSKVTGRTAIQEGARFLEKPQGGRGILLEGVPGVKPAKILILDGGIIGNNTAQMTAGLGTGVTIVDISLARLRHLGETLPRNVKTLCASELGLEKELPDVGLVINSVLAPGGKTPRPTTHSILKMLQPSTVLVDVAIDQGGRFETSRPTTYSGPTYVVDGVVHYAVANIPGAVPYTSTLALTNATLSYVTTLVGKGWEQACKESPALALGLNVVEGKVVHKAIAEVFELKYGQLSLK